MFLPDLSMKERIAKEILLSVFGRDNDERDAETVASDAAKVVIAHIFKSTTTSNPFTPGTLKWHAWNSGYRSAVTDHCLNSRWGNA
jgi:hypothetical protein